MHNRAWRTRSPTSRPSRTRAGSGTALTRANPAARSETPSAAGVFRSAGSRAGSTCSESFAGSPLARTPGCAVKEQPNESADPETRNCPCAATSTPPARGSPRTTRNYLRPVRERRLHGRVNRQCLVQAGDPEQPQQARVVTDKSQGATCGVDGLDGSDEDSEPGRIQVRHRLQVHQDIRATGDDLFADRLAQLRHGGEVHLASRLDHREQWFGLTVDAQRHRSALHGRAGRVIAAEEAKSRVCMSRPAFRRSARAVCLTEVPTHGGVGREAWPEEPGTTRPRRRYAQSGAV